MTCARSPKSSKQMLQGTSLSARVSELLLMAFGAGARTRLVFDPLCGAALGPSGKRVAGLPSVRPQECEDTQGSERQWPEPQRLYSFFPGRLHPHVNCAQAH